MTNDIDEQMMEQVKTSMDEIFEEMKLRLCEMVDRVIDKVFSNFNTMKAAELKSSKKFHDPDEVYAWSELSDTPIWVNSEPKGVLPLIQEPKNQGAITKSLKISSRETKLEWLCFDCYDFLGWHQGLMKSQGRSTDVKWSQYIVEMQLKVGDNKNSDTTANPVSFKQMKYYCEKFESVYSKIFVTKNSLIDINDPYGFRLLVMGRSYVILEVIFVRIKNVKGIIVIGNLLEQDNPILGYGIVKDICVEIVKHGFAKGLSNSLPKFFKYEEVLVGATNIRDCGVFENVMKKQSVDGRLYAVVCASPVVALDSWGLWNELKATCYPSFMEQLTSCATVVESRVQQDGKVVTSCGPGTTMEFALAIMIQAIQRNIIDAGSNGIPSWEYCKFDQTVCLNLYVYESVRLACKFTYRNATLGSTLEDDYFRFRFPIQDGIRLADVLNQTFSTIAEAIEISGTFLTLVGIVMLTIIFMIVLETKGHRVVELEQNGKERAWCNSFNTENQPFHVAKIFIGALALAKCLKDSKAMVAPIEVFKSKNVFIKPSSICVLSHGLVFGQLLSRGLKFPKQINIMAVCSKRMSPSVRRFYAQVKESKDTRINSESARLCLQGPVKANFVTILKEVLKTRMLGRYQIRITDCILEDKDVLKGEVLLRSRRVEGLDP